MKNKLTRQKTIFWILLLVAAITILLFETGTLPKGGLATYGTNGYIIEVAAILLAIVLIPLAGKKFSNSMKKAKNADDETFFKTCRRELEIHIAQLFVVMMTNIGLYYGSDNEYMIYWALIGLVAYIFSFPSNKYLHREKE